MTERKRAPIIPEKIHLVAYQLRSGTIHVPETYKGETSLSNFQASFDVDFNAQAERKSISFVIKVLLQALDEKDQLLPITAEYTLDFMYVIDNFEDYIVSRNKIIVLQNDLLSTLTGISYSTARGVITTRTEGTILKGVILPIIDPNELIVHKRVPDPNQAIDLHSKSKEQYWLHYFGITKEQLLDAISKVGNDPKKVQEELEGRIKS